MPGMMYKKGGAVKKGAMKYQAGGSVREQQDEPLIRRNIGREAEPSAEELAERKRRTRNAERYYGMTGPQRLMERMLGNEGREGGPKRMKKGGMVPKGAAKFQEGGPVKSPERKRRILEGGPKGMPMMTREQSRMARESMTPEERREADAPLSAREMEGMSRRFKKGGVVKKKKAGGMIAKVKGKK